MFIKHFIKQVDWTKKGVEIVRWEIIPIEPLDCDVREFIKEKEALGWEVIGFSETVDGMPAIYAEMPAVLYNTLHKGDLHV
jgi:hypothetical protein